MIKQIKSLLFSAFFRDFSVVFFYDCFSKFFLMLILFTQVRLMPQNEYGVFVKFNSLANLLFGIFASGIGIAFVRFVSEVNSPHNNRTIYSLYLQTVFGITILLIPFFFVTFILKDLYKIQSVFIHFSLIYTVFYSLIKINQFYYQGQEKYSKAGIIEVFRTGTILLAILLLYCLWGTLTIYMVCGAYCVVSFLVFSCSLLTILFKSKCIINKRSLILGKRLLVESGWLLIYCIILALFNQADVLLLSNYASDAEIANYGVAQKYQALALSVLPSLLALMRVKTAKNEYVQSPQKRKEFTIKWIRTTTPGIIFLVVIGALLSKLIFPLINGHQYDNAIPLFQIMLIGVGISYVFSPNVPVIMAAKRFPLLCSLCVVSLLITFLGNYFFIPRWGAVSPSVFFVVSNAFLNIGATISIFMDSKKSSIDCCENH